MSKSRKEPLNPDDLNDDQLANTAATLVYIALGKRALEVLVAKAKLFTPKVEDPQ